jgi:tripartite-type tricarboxylate transporter receptor subunit TctC
VPFGAGGTTDVLARLVTPKAGAALGTSFVIENKAGAGGSMGSDFAAKAAPDGYTIQGGTISSHAINVSLYAKLPYDPVKNFAPVTIIASSPQVVAVHPDVPAKTMKELVDLINAAPDKYNYAAMGIGFGQLSAERLFKLGLKLDRLPRVPFNGAAPAVNSALAGHTPIIILGLPPIAPHLTSHKLRAIAVSSATRSSVFPDVPTFKESGLQNQESELLIGLVTTAGTPPEVVSLLQKRVAEIVVLPDVKSTLDSFSFQAVASTHEQYAAQIKDDIAVWGKVMKDANIPVN